MRSKKRQRQTKTQEGSKNGKALRSKKRERLVDKVTKRIEEI